MLNIWKIIYRIKFLSGFNHLHLLWVDHLFLMQMSCFPLAKDINRTLYFMYKYTHQHHQSLCNGCCKQIRKYLGTIFSVNSIHYTDFNSSWCQADRDNRQIVSTDYQCYCRSNETGTNKIDYLKNLIETLENMKSNRRYGLIE